MVDYKKIINALDLDRVSLMGVENKKEYDIVTIKGGLNGGGDIFYYLTQIDKIVCELSADKREVWLIKWENDCADDIWYLKLGVKETKRISDIKKTISDFCKNQEDFVMKLLNLAKTTSEKLFLIEEIAVHGRTCSVWDSKVREVESKYPLANSTYDIELVRKVTEEEITHYPSRWEGYHVGADTNAFYSPEEVVELAKQIFKARFKGDWYLEWDDLYTYETKTFEL